MEMFIYINTFPSLYIYDERLIFVLFSFHAFLIIYQDFIFTFFNIMMNRVALLALVGSTFASPIKSVTSRATADAKYLFSLYVYTLLNLASIIYSYRC